jgi:hypothetical protein
MCGNKALHDDHDNYEYDDDYEYDDHDNAYDG